MSKFAYKLVVEVDGQQVYSVVLDSVMLAAIAEVRALGSGEQGDELVRLLGYLAQSSYCLVRGIAASNDSIDEDTLELLAKDKVVEVRRRIANHDKFKTWATEEIVIDYIESDVECAVSIATNLNEFTEVDIDTIADMLRNHSHPRVREALAGSCRTPMKILKQLLADPERSVRCAARESLG